MFSTALSNLPFCRYSGGALLGTFKWLCWIIHSAKITHKSIRQRILEPQVLTHLRVGTDPEPFSEKTPACRSPWQRWMDFYQTNVLSLSFKYLAFQCSRVVKNAGTGAVLCGLKFCFSCFLTGQPWAGHLGSVSLSILV